MSMARSTLRTLVLRYRPVAVASVVAVAVISLIPPLDLPERNASEVAPFVDAPVATPPDSVAPPRAGGAGTDATGSTVTTSAPPVGTLPPPRRPADDGSGAPAVFARLPSSGAGGIAVAADGSVVVTLADVDGHGALALFDPGGTLARTLTLNGGRGLTDVALRDDATALVLATTPAAVLTVALSSGEVLRSAPVPDVEPCIPLAREESCDASSSDQPALPSAVALAPDGAAFVADAGQSAIWRVAPGGGQVTQWLNDSAFAARQGPGGPTGLAFDGAGNLVIALPRSLGSDNGSVYLQVVGPDGGPAERRRLALLGDNAHPTGVVLGITGRIFLPLPDQASLQLLNNEGGAVRAIKIAEALGAGMLGGAAFSDRDVLLAARDAVVRVPVGELGGRDAG